MSMGVALLALGALLLASGKKKGATTKVVSKMPDLPSLPVFNESQVFDDSEQAKSPGATVFKEADAAAAKEDAVQPLDAWGPQPLPQKAVSVVQPPLEMDADQNEAVVQQPVVVAPGTAAEAAASNPGVQVEEVVQADPVAAARELADYVAANRGKGAKLGTKGAPSAAVRALQMQMGVDADGIYGPATRARGKALGVTMPPRA